MNERSIFEAALDRKDPEQRSVYLNEACGADQPLRHHIEGLLKAHEMLGSFLAAPPPAPAATIDEPITERPGTVIGAYKLMEQIGEGGMGLVFVAEQQHPVRRKVALKVIKPGMDTRQVIARFEAERQALALMDHPNIAKVLDGGETASGRPYFVMELVKGLPITENCDQNQVPIRERLDLFLNVCQAVQHAHQKGIIHRDIKPSNVLILSHDGTPLVKVIDFGVAKAIGQQLTDKTIYTQFAQLVGTPLYMSPEQAGQSGVDVDTRTDIYALGVLLYELLTATTPFDKERLKDASYDEIRRIIREEEPPKPSTRISTLGQAATWVSTNRRSNPKQLSQVVRGELDWIVMKALEKDRNRRYETASAFAADVQRYLQDEPVQACPPSAGYHLRKFLRRNKTCLTTATVPVIAFLLVAGTLGWTMRDRAARQDKLEGSINQALEETQAEYERDNLPEARARIQRIDTLLAGDTDVSDEIRHRVDEWRAELAILQRLEDLALPSLERAQKVQIDAAYAQVFLDIGIDIDALPAEEAGRRIRTHLTWKRLTEALDAWSLVRHDIAFLNPPPPEASLRKLRLLQVARAADQDDLSSQARLAAEKWDLAAAERLAGLPEVSRLPAAALTHLAMIIYYAFEEHPSIGSAEGQSRRENAVRLVRNVLVLRPGDFGLNATCAHWYSRMDPPRWAEAAHYFSITVALRPENHYARARLAQALENQGKLDDAIAQYREAIRLKSDVARTHNNFGVALQHKGQLDEAIAEWRKAIALDPNDAMFHRNLGNALREQGKLDEAIAEFRQAIEFDPKDAQANFSLGVALLHKGQLDEAITAYRDAIRINADYLEAHNNVGLALQHKGQLTEAIAEFRQAILIKKNEYEPHSNLGEALRQKGQLDEAIAEFRQAIRIKENEVEAHCNLGTALVQKRLLDEAIAEFRQAIRIQKNHAAAHCNLGEALRRKGQLDEAIAEYREALRINKDFSEAHANLGIALRDQGKLDEAVEEYREVSRIKEDSPEAHCNLGIALCEQGKLDEAIAYFRKAIRIKEDYAEAHFNLGTVLAKQQKLDEAITEYRKAIGLKKDYLEAHYDLGIVLKTQGKLDEAIGEYCEAIRIKDDCAEAHCNLGHALRQQGEFRQALEELRRGHLLGSKNPGWRYSSPEWVRQCERLVELDEKLPGFLDGKTTPASPAEQIELAGLCSLKHLNRTAVRFYEKAFAAEPSLVAPNRYKAACMAALAGCGQGKDAAKLDEKEQSQVRRQALNWLRADLEANHPLLENYGNKVGPTVAGNMRHSLANPDFAGVRGPEALGKLPEDERQPWQDLWKDVADMLKQAQEKAAPEKKK